LIIYQFFIVWKVNLIPSSLKSDVTNDWCGLRLACVWLYYETQCRLGICIYCLEFSLQCIAFSFTLYFQECIPVWSTQNSNRHIQRFMKCWSEAWKVTNSYCMSIQGITCIQPMCTEKHVQHKQGDVWSFARLSILVCGKFSTLFLNAITA